jgi:hypothetical protein
MIGKFPNLPLIITSSCDHFVMDGKKYKWIDTKDGSMIVKNNNSSPKGKLL